MTVTTSPAQAGLALLKPRFLIALALVMGFALLGVHHKDKFDTVYRQLPAIRGNRPMTTTERLVDAEEIYQRSVKNRHQALDRAGFGTDNFNAWDPFMNWWWYFQAAFYCPHDIQRIGSYGDGGKWVCGFRLLEAQKATGKKCVVYSLGVSSDSSFESEIVERTNCDVFAFDASVGDMAGPAKGNPRIHFNKVFIGAEDKIDDQGNVWKTLKTVMKENGHEWIDILKMDIESSEYGAMDALMKEWEVLPFSQFQVEMHLIGEMDLEAKTSFPRFLTWFENLEKWHLRPFWNELNVIPIINPRTTRGLHVIEFSFLNLAGDHLLLHG